MLDSHSGTPLADRVDGNTMVGIGLIGAGGMAGVYADCIAEMPNADLVGVASPNTAASFVAEHAPSATAYSSAGELCADEAVDAVAILTPTHTHADLVDTAAEAGLDIICEKPLARTLDEAHRIKQAVDTAGITFMTAHVVRFFPEYAKAADLVESGDIGEPGVAYTRRAFGFEGTRGWFDDHEKSGGVLLDLAIHDFDYLRSVLGEVETVFTRHTEWSVEARSEVSMTMLTFASGVIGHVEAWLIEVPGIPFTTAFELAGDDGLIEFDIESTRPITTWDESGHHVPRDPIGDEVPFGRDPYRAQLDEFVEAIETGGEPAIPVEEGIASMRISLAAIESAERGMPVSPMEVGQ